MMKQSILGEKEAVHAKKDFKVQEMQKTSKKFDMSKVVDLDDEINDLEMQEMIDGQ